MAADEVLAPAHGQRPDRHAVRGSRPATRRHGPGCEPERLACCAIEGITSPDGRVFGKMGHSERSGDGLYVNVPGNKYQPIFEAGVEYFTA